MTRFIKDKKGFTLIELMVTLVVTGILLGSIFQIVFLQQRISQSQNRVRDAQQGLRNAMDLVNADMRALPPDQIDVHFRGATWRIRGILVLPDTTPMSVDTVFADTLIILKPINLAALGYGEVRSRRSVLINNGAECTFDAFGDTMASVVAPIPVEDATPFQNFLADNNLSLPQPVFVKGPDLDRYDFLKIYDHPGSPFSPSAFQTTPVAVFRDIGNFVTSIPELIVITGITPGNPTLLAHDAYVEPTNLPVWNPADGALLRRYGYYGYPPSTDGDACAGYNSISDSTSHVGIVPTPGTSDIEIQPVRIIAMYVIYDPIVRKYRLMRYENGIAEVLADDIRILKVNPTAPGSQVITVRIEAWVPKESNIPPLDDDPANFIVRSDSLTYYRI